ncbi:MAG TPA: HEAT repeat domain-containing protein [Rhodothermales bacterium]|nr:HEAT repeat domain-containing protein [Rhodothermales bacterium]
MKPKVHARKRTLLASLVLLLGWIGTAQAQPVIRHPQPSEALTQKWAWAMEEGRTASQNGFWIGYSIQRRMRENSFIGSWSTRVQRTSLHELIYNEKPAYGPYDRDRKGSDRIVVKEVAMLFEFGANGSEPIEIDVSNLSGYVDLEGKPLLWLEGAGDDESLALVQQQYARARDVDVQEDAVSAIAMHESTGKLVPILSDILTGDADDEVREQAAFWLGQQDDKMALDLLVRTARTDRSEDVREQAVFGISQTELPEATDILIDLARNERGEVAEKAVFWLGQRASERAAEALGDLVDDSPDTEIQKQAVFAISQLPDEKAVPMLIKIARTHPKLKVRKQAIFWLSESDDPRALEAIIDLARG